VTRSLKLVPHGAETAAEPVTMAEAVADLIATILAQRPVTLTVLWEPPGGEPDLQIASLPGSLALTQGMIRAAYRQLWPEEFGEAADD
jgi:hypothetical protein